MGTLDASSFHPQPVTVTTEQRFRALTAMRQAAETLRPWVACPECGKRLPVGELTHTREYDMTDAWAHIVPCIEITQLARD